MRSSTLYCALAATFLLTAPAAAQTSQKQVSAQEAAAEIQLRDVKTFDDGALNGTLVNTSNGVMKGVKLLVKHSWAWKDERHPGDDSPGRSGYISIPGEIPAGASVPFNYTPDPPLPTRSDGHFTTTVGVQEFSKVGN